MIAILIVVIIYFVLAGQRSQGIRTSSFNSPTEQPGYTIGPRTPLSPIQQILSLYGKPINALAPIPRRLPVNGATPMMNQPKANMGGGAPSGGGSSGGGGGSTPTAARPTGCNPLAVLMSSNSLGGCTCLGSSNCSMPGTSPILNPLPGPTIIITCCAPPTICNPSLACSSPILPGYNPQPAPPTCATLCAPAPCYCLCYTQGGGGGGGGCTFGGTCLSTY
jgi:hypothetical protein